MDFNLKVPAVDKLLDYTASGIGAVAGPMLAPWRARRRSNSSPDYGPRKGRGSSYYRRCPIRCPRRFGIPCFQCSGRDRHSRNGTSKNPIPRGKTPPKHRIRRRTNRGIVGRQRRALTKSPTTIWTARFFNYIQGCLVGRNAVPMGQSFSRRDRTTWKRIHQKFEHPQKP